MSSTIKADAVSWLASNFGVKSKSVYASKFYVPEKSRTKQSAWWLEIPRAAIETPSSAEIHLVCQVSPHVEEFHYLKVPVEFLKKEMSVSLCVRKVSKSISFCRAE